MTLGTIPIPNQRFIIGFCSTKGHSGEMPLIIKRLFAYQH